MIRRHWIVTLFIGAGLALAGLAWASGANGQAGWAELSAAQRQALAPLEKDWASIDVNRRAKWLEVANRFPTMPAEERARLQARMAAWARMTPVERSQARLQFQEVRQVPDSERQQKWQAYQALPEAERQALAARARPAARAASGAAPSPAPAKLAEAEGKRNVVQPSPPARAKAVTPTAQQARPGATTTTMTTRPLPPAHAQVGLPKIAATPGFVDPSTLLPQRGPQGAAVRAAAAASATSSDAQP